jgi:hypothetical protein
VCSLFTRREDSSRNRQHQAQEEEGERMHLRNDIQSGECDTKREKERSVTGDAGRRAPFLLRPFSTPTMLRRRNRLTYRPQTTLLN